MCMILSYTPTPTPTVGSLAWVHGRGNVSVLWPLYSRFVAVFVRCLASAVSDWEQWEGLVCLLIVSYRIGGGEHS